jgi:DNA modification methylase
VKHYSDDWLTVYGGDVREVLPTLPADSVDCIVTSPPYWGLRDYGTATWIGGDEACQHEGSDRRYTEQTAAVSSSGAFSEAGADNAARLKQGRWREGGSCVKCGATHQDSQLGLEATPEEYVANLVGVFRELRRVLKPSGTCWLNLGDSYGHGTDAARQRSQTSEKVSEAQHEAQGGRHGGMAKQLVGIPWRVAFALQADGWWLRSDIIWSKPNPMPESVTDRPTKAHEYLFLLTKSARYYYDADAVAEQSLVQPGSRADVDRGGFGGKWAETNGKEAFRSIAPTRNLRSVWTIATRPYPGAHFAVFPPELPERCIKAGSSERGVCPECGAPWERVVERIGESVSERLAKARRHHSELPGNGALQNNGHALTPDGGKPSQTIGWQPTCAHVTLKPTGAVVLDPFAGSGTVGLVANRLSRRAILIDLNPAYLEQQMKRNAQTVVGL